MQVLREILASQEVQVVLEVLEQRAAWEKWVSQVRLNVNSPSASRNSFKICLGELIY